MKLKLIDLFKRITWAKNGDLTDFSQTNYEAGWAHLGDDTPTVQDFNYVQQMNDKKDQWLFNQLKAVLEKANIEPTEENVNSLRDAILALSKGYSHPKSLTADTVNFVDEQGHTHEIAKATLQQQGITQLYTGYNSQREDLALTPKTAYQLKQLIDSNTRSLGNVIPNSKKSSVVNSNSNHTVATSAAVKTAYDKAVSAEENNLYQKIYVGKNDLQLDLTERQQIINLFGNKYRNNGHLSFSAHNNSNSNITGLPLTNKSPIVMTFYLMGGYSVFYCDYPLLNRRFYSNVNFNNKTLTFNWIEHITSAGDQLDIKGYKSFNSTVESKYRFVIRRNDEKYTPYMWFIDQGVDMSGETARNKSIGELTFSVGAGDGVRKNIIKSYVLADKNSFLELGGWNAENRYKVLFKGFTKTGNVTIGASNDNGVDRLQVNGTISANTPPVNATDDKVVTVGWAKQAGKSYVKKTGDTMTGNLEIDRGDDYAGIILHNKSKIAMIESTPDSENQFLNLIYRTRDYQNVNVIKVPKKTGTLALLEDIKNVHRRDYNRTINGTSNWDNGKSKTITLTGSVTIYPDGRIVQILHLKNFRIMWFDAESPTVGYADPGYRHPLIKIPLWSAMPNKILSAMPQIVRTTHPTTSIAYVSEAGEWISAWAIREQGNDKGNVYINTRRFAGGHDEIVDLYVVIEGY
ncbi:TPA: phage tail protein [Haemophilus influenzae]